MVIKAQPWGCIDYLNLGLTACDVTLDKLLDFSESQFPLPVK